MDLIKKYPEIISGKIPKGFQIRENTSLEILNAIKEVFERKRKVTNLPYRKHDFIYYQKNNPPSFSYRKVTFKYYHYQRYFY